MPEALPPCGLYRMTTSIGEVPAGRLVYFHNHGDPGPGLYLPEGWDSNRARFSSRGMTMPEPVVRHASTLEPLVAEGFYRVTRAFFCCEKRCREFEPELMVQLGYNGAGDAILFVPELTTAGLALPTTGSIVRLEQLANVSPLKVARSADATRATGGALH